MFSGQVWGMRKLSTNIGRTWPQPLPVHTPAEAKPALVIWLGAILVLLAAMILLGGATRLTDSGLSITEWQVVSGALPPLSEASWNEAFEKYKQIPEYALINAGMTLNEFKVIYWWEWSHRFLGRLIGLAFALPFFVFLVSGRIGGDYVWKLTGLFILGGLQGALGWFMVQSGLVDRVDVSQYRLAAHLGLAFVIFGAVAWVRWDLAGRAPISIKSEFAPLIRYAAVGLLVLIFLQIVAGAFVAGIKAGHTYNTWPLMDGALVPKGYWFVSPWYLNFFDNAASVQFNHRVLAYVILALTLGLAIVVFRRAASLSAPALILVGTVLVQVLLGIWTLLAVVPLPLGVLHQAGGIAVFAAALNLAYTSQIAER